MRTNLKKTLGLATLCLSMFSNAMPTWAGAVLQEEVTIVTEQHRKYARGSLVGTRNSADPTKRIGCGLYFHAVGLRAECNARIGNTLFSCVSSDPTIIASVQSMTDSSTIYFETRNGALECYQVIISSDSGALK